MPKEAISNYANSLDTFANKTRQILASFAESRFYLEKMIAAARQEPGYFLAALSLVPPLPLDNLPYSRLVVYSGPEGEAMIASWPKGSQCLPHDHGDSHGVVTVLKGSFLEESFSLKQGLEKKAREIYSEGSFMPVAPGDIHRMEALEEGVTLHLYAPVIRAMKVYDENHGSILTVGKNCGAWIPSNPSLILHRASLHGDSIHN